MINSPSQRSGLKFSCFLSALLLNKEAPNVFVYICSYVCLCLVCECMVYAVNRRDCKTAWYKCVSGQASDHVSKQASQSQGREKANIVVCVCVYTCHLIHRGNTEELLFTFSLKKTGQQNGVHLDLYVLYQVFNVLCVWLVYTCPSCSRMTLSFSCSSQ